MKRSLSKTLAFILLTSVAALFGDEIKIRGTALANWWTLGETVSFRIEKGILPPGTKKIVARIFDSSNTKLAENSIDADAFASDGFSWKSVLPGLHYAEFSIVDEKGHESKIEESVEVKIGTRAKKSFQYSKRFFAVLPQKARAPGDCPPVIGASAGWNPGNKANVETELEACLLLGFHFIRLQPMHWAKIEKERAIYDWSEPDWWIEGAEKRGFEVIVNPWGTPKWAASNQSTEVGFLFPDYMKSPPAKMDYWTNFLKAAMDRYPKVRQWQLWNEAGLPAQSCFWNGKPEQYIELLKAGYEAVKAKNPDAVVWDGCPIAELYAIGMTLGEWKYFDKLDLHGKWIGQRKSKPGRHDETEQAAGVKKPWGSLEWHAILNCAEDQRLSEEKLSRNMLLDFMDLIRTGAELAAIHSVFNNQEMEMLDFYSDNGDSWAHAAGLFRRQPAIEPRLPGVALRNFMDCLSGKVEYLEGYAFPDDFQFAGLLKSSSGELLVIWQNARTPQAAAPELLRAFAADSILLDWEGRTLKADENFILEPEKVYFLKNPALKTLVSWDFKAQVLNRSAVTPELDNSMNGLYRPGRLFDKGMNVIDAENLRWMELPVYVLFKNNTAKPESFSARFAAAMDEDALELLVEVRDSRHIQFSKDINLWEGDSVQIALDTVGKGAMEDRVEICAALGPAGPVLWKQKNADSDGLILANCTHENNLVKNGKIAIERKGAETIYYIRIDKGELHPFKALKGVPMRFSLLVNDNNGSGREGWLEWGSGIGKSKSPERYGNLTVDPGKGEVINQKSLRGKIWDAKLDFSADFVRVSALEGSSGNAGVAAALDFVPGARYEVSFKARGDAVIEGLAMVRKEESKWERIDFLKPGVQTFENWKEFKCSFSAPLQPAKLSVWIFFWKQKTHFFEIKDFKVEAGI